MKPRLACPLSVTMLPCWAKTGSFYASRSPIFPKCRGGKGVRLQRHGDGHLADIRCYAAKEGLKLNDKAGRERVFTELDEWVGLRGQAGRIRPKGFPTDGLMGPAFANRL